MADHTREDIDLLVKLMRQAMVSADEIYRTIREKGFAEQVEMPTEEKILSASRAA